MRGAVVSHGRSLLELGVELEGASRPRGAPGRLPRHPHRLQLNPHHQPRPERVEHLPCPLHRDALVLVALAADNGIDYLLTWNCKHIANAKTRNLIERCLRSRGYHPPVLCTPEELMEP